MALDTVQDYIDRARVLLLDQIEPYRYTQTDLVEALNLAILETRRLRPELLSDYFNATLPDFDVSNLSETVPIDPQYRVAFLYYICGHAHLRDGDAEERASALLNKFAAQMLSIQS